MKIKTILMVLVAAKALISCTKEDSITTFYNAHSCFYVENKIIYVDSSVQFINCSDTVDVSYLWRFGDGYSSTEKNPVHRYKNHGNYTASLVTFVDNMVTDTTYKVIKVTIGEKYFDFMAKTEGYDLAECSDSSILVFAYTYNGYDQEHEKRFMVKFDKNLKINWIKYLTNEFYPTIGNIDPISDGNFIVSSFSYSSRSGNYTITKIDSGGNILLNKSFNEVYGRCKYVAEAKDQGFILIGDENKLTTLGDTFQYTTIVKADMNGNFQWKKNFANEGWYGGENVIPLDDGYLFATNEYTDSLIVMKIDLNGNIIWKTIKEWQIPDSHTIYNVFGSTISQNDNFIIVANKGNDMLMFFDHDGNFIKRVSTGISSYQFIQITHNNNFIACGGDTYWENVGLHGYDATGSEDWTNYYGKRESSCRYGFITNTKLLNDGNILFLGTSFKGCSPPKESSLLLFKINDKGVLQ